MDDFGAALSFGFGLPGDGADHLLGKVYLLDFHQGHLDAPSRGLVIENGLQAQVEFFTLAQQFVKFHFAQHAAKGGLRELRGGVEKVGHLDDGQARFDDPEIDYRVHLDGDVVARDNVLRGNFQSVDAEGDADHPGERGEYQDHARPLRLRQQPAQPEDDAALVFSKNFDGTQQVKHYDRNDYDSGVDHEDPPVRSASDSTVNFRL